MDTEQLRKQAEAKVEASKNLSQYKDFIMADWDEGDEHWQWVIDSSEDEIIDWVEAIGK